MNIEHKLRLLRANLRKNAKVITEMVVKSSIVKGYDIAKITPEICMFCGREDSITKEHVMPRWLFENNPDKFFITKINELNQTYNKATIPACKPCNSEILNTLEKHILKLFKEIDLASDLFTNSGLQHIIRWLEIIDYKFQILNVRRKFIASKSGGYIPYFADFPLSVMRPEKDYSPNKVVAEIRRSQKRVTVKSKDQNLNSLVIFKTSNPDFHFFHKMDDFIFVEFPRRKIALFYFYKLTFLTEKDAHAAAVEIIDAVY
jgi:hypothetical protein